MDVDDWDGLVPCDGCGGMYPILVGGRCGPCNADLTAPPASSEGVAAGLAAAREAMKRRDR